MHKRCQKGRRNGEEDATNLRGEREGGAARRGEVEKGGVYGGGRQGVVERRRGRQLHLWHRINVIQLGHSHIGLQRGERRRGRRRGERKGGANKVNKVLSSIALVSPPTHLSQGRGGPGEAPASAQAVVPLLHLRQPLLLPLQRLQRHRAFLQQPLALLRRLQAQLGGLRLQSGDLLLRDRQVVRGRREVDSSATRQAPPSPSSGPRCCGTRLAPAGAAGSWSLAPPPGCSPAPALGTPGPQTSCSLLPAPLRPEGSPAEVIAHLRRPWRDKSRRFARWGGKLDRGGKHASAAEEQTAEPPSITVTLIC